MMANNTNKTLLEVRRPCLLLFPIPELAHISKGRDEREPPPRAVIGPVGTIPGPLEDAWSAV